MAMGSGRGWLQTFTSRRVFPYDPSVEEIAVEDIAHALSLTNRFAGHTRLGYSVAQHSYLVAEHCPLLYRLLGLLHDAAEAYIGDLPAPIKNDSSMGNYRLLEAHLLSVIYKAFGVDASGHIARGMPPDVAFADARMLATEARDLLGPPPEPWLWLPEPYPEVIVPVSAAEAEREFLRHFVEYGGKNPEPLATGALRVEGGRP